jgi:gliding motility-associated-like protein
MKFKSTRPGDLKELAVLLFCLLITIIPVKSYAQIRIYANQVSMGNAPADHVDNPGNAVLDNSDFATVKSSGGTLGIGRYNGQLELKFPAKLPAGKTSYVRIDFDPDVLNALLGGNLGGALADVLGSVILGNHYFNVKARDGATDVLSGSSTGAFNDSRMKLIKDAAGRFYVALTPALPYDRIYIQDVTSALLLGGTNQTKVYNAFYTDGTDPCAQGFATSFDGTGLTVDLLGLGKAGVTNMERAIDANPNNYSEISLGILGVAGTISQDIYFETLSKPTDDINIRIQADPALLNVGLLNNISITAFNGVTEVKTVSVSSLLNLDLLGLLNSGQIASVPFAPGLPYNRVRITLSSLLNASLTQTLNLYSATRSAGRPAFTAPASDSVPVCAGNTASLSATTSADNELRWYESQTGGTALATVAYNVPFVTPQLSTNKTYYVSARQIGCTAESLRVPVNVLVTPIPAAPAVAAVAPVCAGTAATLSVSTPLPGIVYRWYDTEVAGSVLSTGNSYTTAALILTKTFYVEAASGTCTSSMRTPVEVVVNPTPAAPVVSTNNEIISSGQTATLSATAEAGTTINWYAGPTGGAPLAAGTDYTTPELTATTTYYAGSTNASGCPSSVRVPVTVTITGGPVNPNCKSAIAQQTGINGVCLLCSVTGAGNSTDANLTNFTRINLVAGVGATGYQRLIFSNGGVATDSIRLDLETPVGLADLSVLGGITVRVMNGANIVSTYPLNAALLNLKLLGGNRFTATLPAGGVFDRVEVRFGALVAALSNLSIYGAEIIYPNPVVSANGLTLCSGSSASLSASAAGGTTLRWYNAPTGGNLLETGENYTTPVLTASTTYYIEVSKGSCANTARIPVTVTVTTPPLAPVLAAVAPVCSGSAAVLSVSSPGTGLTYHWYDSATGDTPLFTGPVFKTPLLAASTIYYVSAANGDCVSATRTAVPVSVSPRPALPQIQASSTAVSPGQTAILTATSADANITFKWYTSANSTTPVYTGATYVTPPLTVTTTYYLEAVSNTTGCSAPSRVQVTIAVSGGAGPNPVPCESATASTEGVVGAALLAGVFNPELAIDNNTTTGSSLVMPVGLLGASVFQRLSFTSLSNVGDTVRVLLRAPGKLLSASVLGNITVSTYNNGTSNNDGLALNSALIRVELLSGNNAALVSFVPAQQFNRIEVRLKSGLLGALTSIDVNYAQRLPVAPELVSSEVTVCTGQSAVLTVQNPKPGIAYKWYDATGTYQSGKDGITFTTPALTAATRYYLEANTASGCSSYRTAVSITVTPAPQIPSLVSTTINTCLNSDVTLAVSDPISGINYKWYNGAGVYQAGKDGVTFTITGVSGATTYSVEAVNSCGVASVSRTTATVNVGTLDIPVIIPASLTVRSGSPAVLNATSSTSGATINWYTNAIGGVSVFEGSRYETPPLINNTSSPIQITYYVSAAVVGGCPPSARASVVVTVIPNGSPTDVPCEPATIAVRQGVDGVAILTGVFNPGLAADNDVESASSFVMPLGVLGASIYQQVGFNGLSTLGDTIRVRISSPGKLLSLAVLPSVELTTFVGNVSNNDRIIASNPLITLELLSDNSGAILTFVPQKQFDGVELRLRSGLASVLTSLDFNYARRIIVAPTVESNVATTCEGTSATLTVRNPVAGITYKWYRGTTYLTGKDGTTLVTDASLPAGSYDYFVSATRNGCESAKTKVSLTVLGAPLQPVAASGNPTAICPETSAELKVTPVAGVSFNWYDALTAGNLLAANTATYVIPANLATGVHDFYVEAVNGNSCISNAPRTKISITIKPFALASDINITGSAIPFCAGATVTLTAASTTVTNPVFTWYSDAALTSVVATGVVFSPTATTTRTYYVTVSGANKCANTTATAKAVVVTVNPPATAADIDVTGAGTTLCSGTAATLTASTTTVTNPVFTFYHDAALTDVAFAGGPVFTTPVLTANKTYYVTVRGTNKCENLAAAAEIVVVNVNPPALADDISVSGAGSPFCAGTTATLTATSTTVTNPVFTWYSDASLTTVLQSGAVFSPVVNATATYYVTVRGNNKCENTAATARAVLVTVNPPAIAADISVTGASASFCAGSSATLSATSTTATNPVFTWYNDAALTSIAHVGAAFNTPLLTATKTYYVTVRGSNKCENTAATAKVVTLTVNPPAVAADITVIGTESPFCAGSSAKLTASSTTVTNPVFTWYSDAALTVVAATGPVFDTPALPASRTYYVTVQGSNKCENTPATAKTVSVTVNPPALMADIAVAGNTVPFCTGTKASLTASSTTVTNPVFTWYSDATLTTVVASGAAFQTPELSVATTYYVTVRGTNKCENTIATARVVTLKVTPLPLPPALISGAAAPQCAATGTTVLTVDNPDAQLNYRWFSTPAGGTPLAEGMSFTTPVLAATTTYYVEALSKATGCISAVRTSVTVTILPKLDAPVVSIAAATATSVTFQWNSVTGATAYEVSIDNGLNWISPTNGTGGTTYVYEGLQPDQSVTIRVRAKGQLDCQLSDATTFTGKTSNPLGNTIFVPNTFTPNNDGKNDVLYVYGNTVSKLKLRVYNQWGQFIYESLSMQNGWDGTYKGELQPNGVYVYYLDAEFNDGTKTTKKGTITLLR